MRFRAVLMTAFAFILGVVPLVLASGAGAASRVVLGINVHGGMAAASVIGIIFIPGLYVMFQWFGDKLSGVPDTPGEPGPHGGDRGDRGGRGGGVFGEPQPQPQPQPQGAAAAAALASAGPPVPARTRSVLAKVGLLPKKT
jgi:hypothetical protein